MNDNLPNWTQPCDSDKEGRTEFVSSFRAFEHERWPDSAKSHWEATDLSGNVWGEWLWRPFPRIPSQAAVSGGYLRESARRGDSEVCSDWRWMECGNSLRCWGGDKHPGSKYRPWKSSSNNIMLLCNTLQTSSFSEQICKKDEVGLGRRPAQLRLFYF